MWYAKVYDPLTAGSIDGTDTIPHDHAVQRAQEAVLTGDSRGYAFIEYTHEKSCQDAYKNANRMILDDKQILVDYERSRIMQGWVPRRLGGGFGGRKESGQLRFGARDRPFKRPFATMTVGGETFFNPRISSRTTHPSDQSFNKRDLTIIETMDMQDTLNTTSGRLIGVVVLDRGKRTILGIDTEMG
ncbi:62_t:CDS:2 [Paraglomus occultum]|uniref:62_t:CDS:1 n=1 Tax=Paraglomus occultum TaxID=144539 RepID=A0A9N9CGX9_9GLOM|nr:62_t:CDS:2 [Paraglomus occultum]